MPGATIGATYASGSRSFDFSNLASEGVQAVEVYKTSRADIPSGGMGATINIVTPKPLEMGSRASVGIKGVWDDSSSDDKLTPEISGIYSETFADGKFGVAVTGSYQKRESGSAAATTGAGWSSIRGSVDMDWGGEEHIDWAWGGMGMGHVQHQLAGNDGHGIPQQLTYVFGQTDRERINGQMSRQFAPSENLTATLDYTYSSQELGSTYHDLGAWFALSNAPQSAIFTANDTPTVQTPLLYSEISSGVDLSFGYGVDKVDYEIKFVIFHMICT